MTPLLFIDGHQLLYRAWFGFPTRITNRDKSRDLTGVFGFLALARKAHLLHGLGHELVVVFDGQHATATRARADAGYKANRADADHTPIKSLADVKRALDVAGVTWIELDDHEADDVIATLTLAAVSNGRTVTCHSGDRDLYQLLDRPGVTVLSPARAIVTSNEIRRRYRVRPRQWPDFRALAGDPADNIPGVPGIGPKTAAVLLADGWHLDDLPGTARMDHPRCGPLIEQWPQVMTWRELIRLDPKVPLPDDAHPAGRPTPPLPTAAKLLERIDLW